MKILAIPATNSRNGLNRQLLEHASSVIRGGIRPDAEVEVLDLNDFEMPIYSQERQEASGIPEPAQRFYDAIGAADAVIVSFAEHNGSYSVAWKNVYDWASCIEMGVYQGKKVAMLATSPGGRGGAGVLGSATMTAPFFGADLVGSLSVPSFYENFDSERGELTNPDLRASLESLLSDLTDGSTADAA